MKYRKQFRGAPGSGVRPKDFNPQFVDKHEKKETADFRINTLPVDLIGFFVHAGIYRRKWRQLALFS